MPAWHGVCFLKPLTCLKSCLTVCLLIYLLCIEIHKDLSRGSRFSSIDLNNWLKNGGGKNNMWNLVLSKIFKLEKAEGMTWKEQERRNGVAQEMMPQDALSLRARSLIELNITCVDNSGRFWNKRQCSPNRLVEDSYLSRFRLVSEESLGLNEVWVDVNCWVWIHCQDVAGKLPFNPSYPFWKETKFLPSQHTKLSANQHLKKKLSHESCSGLRCGLLGWRGFWPATCKSLLCKLTAIEILA